MTTWADLGKHDGRAVSARDLALVQRGAAIEVPQEDGTGAAPGALRLDQSAQGLGGKKRVVATAGDRFCSRPELGTHVVGARPMPSPSPEALRLGLKPWAGCRVLEPGEVVG